MTKTTAATPSRVDFHAKQLQLLTGHEIALDDAREAVASPDAATAHERLEEAFLIPAELLEEGRRANARAFVDAVLAGTAPDARGESREDAVVLGPEPGTSGVWMEYEWLEWRFGERDADWTPVRQEMRRDGDRAFDRVCVELADGTERWIEFDITSFF